MHNHKKLTRDTNNKMLAGVLSGIARYTDSDVTLWRVGFAIGFIFTGFAPLGIAYIFAWILMPVSIAEPTDDVVHNVTND
jgi:phage shock protein PspC (stress-responsive transcriptional regulator)